MSAGIKGPPRVLYILLDMSNGDYPAKNYTWWFISYRAAVAHRNRQNADVHKARLEGPYRYERGGR